MYRVMRDMCRAVRSRVRINGQYSRTFETAVGVRQGSALSPLLFSVFINGVVEEWKRAGLGVVVGDRAVAGLLIADDIVLIAPSTHELQRALDIMDEYARKHRFRFNASKCAVVACATQSETGVPWSLQGESIPEARHYKYLGVVFQSNGKWVRWAEAREARGRLALHELWFCGARAKALELQTGHNLVDVLLRPAMLYGAEIANISKAQAQRQEVVQVKAGRMLLGLPGRTPGVMVRGELGWITMEARRHIAMLRFFYRLQRMDGRRLVRQVFRTRMLELRSSKTGRPKRGLLRRVTAAASAVWAAGQVEYGVTMLSS